MISNAPRRLIAKIAKTAAMNPFTHGLAPKSHYSERTRQSGNPEADPAKQEHNPEGEGRSLRDPAPAIEEESNRDRNHREHAWGKNGGQTQSERSQQEYSGAPLIV